ncbi:MAG: hypothetical protein ABEJ64_02135 [Candidatus Nanohaloarchaea archaeon]
MSLEETVEEALGTVHPDEILEFGDFVAERLSRRDWCSGLQAERVVDELFQMGYYDQDSRLAEAAEEEMEEALREYREDELFQIELPAFQEPFQRKFFRHESPEGGTPGFKAYYESPDGDWMALVPKDSHARTKREKTEQVGAVIHNTEVIEGHGLKLPCTYKPAVATRNGDRVPVVYGKVNRRMKLKNEMTEEEWRVAQPEIAQASQKMKELVVNGLVASSKLNDYYGEQAPLNQAYDFQQREPVIPDSGELHDPIFDNPYVPHDSREEFLEYHGIDERVDRMMDVFGLKEENR